MPIAVLEQVLMSLYLIVQLSASKYVENNFFRVYVFGPWVQSEDGEIPLSMMCNGWIAGEKTKTFSRVSAFICHPQCHRNHTGSKPITWRPEKADSSVPWNSIRTQIFWPVFFPRIDPELFSLESEWFSLPCARFRLMIHFRSRMVWNEKEPKGEHEMDPPDSPEIPSPTNSILMGVISLWS